MDEKRYRLKIGNGIHKYKDLPSIEITKEEYEKLIYSNFIERQRIMDRLMVRLKQYPEETSNEIKMETRYK